MVKWFLEELYGQTGDSEAAQKLAIARSSGDKWRKSCSPGGTAI